ncbi:MAG: ISAzo13 family transposase [Parabacteroides sp.]
MKVKFDCKKFFEDLDGFLDEKTRRYVVAAASSATEYGGATLVAKAAGISRSVIYNGQKELKAIKDVSIPIHSTVKQRKKGAGPKWAIDKDPGLLKDLNSLIQPYVHGDPESPLRWTSRSLRHLATELGTMGHQISHVSVGKLLESIGYTLQSNKKSHEGGNSHDRDGQFKHINQCVTAFQDEDLPVISVDAKKKELVGNFKNAGREYHPMGMPPEVEVYDFVNENGKATPYGIYDITANEGFVNVSISPDTAAFAVDSIRRWWKVMGMPRYGEARALLINADGGGSNGSHNKLWKVELQKMANDYDMSIYVSHFPPGTSKWNKIEHKMFAFISMNWRGKPLQTTEIIVKLIANTKSKGGLSIKAELSKKMYKTGVKITDDKMGELNILYNDFHPEWNYVIMPQKTASNV